jgi:CspA family cold shock protein
MPQGTVKWFNDTKAFGFIAPDEGDDVFVHVTGLAEGVTTIKEEQRVEFEVTQGRKGLQAVDVKPIADAPAAAEPVVAEPAADDEPVTDDEPAADDEPADDEPAEEEPAADESAE